MWFNEDVLRRRLDSPHERGARVRFIGDLADPRIPDRNRRRMAEAAARTAGNRPVRCSVRLAENEFAAKNLSFWPFTDGRRLL